MSPGDPEKWVPVGIWTGNAAISLPEHELDLFKIACHRRGARVAWILRAFVIRTILQEFKDELRPEWLEAFDRTYRDLLAQQMQPTNTRKGVLKVHGRIAESVARVRDLFKGRSVNVG